MGDSVLVLTSRPTDQPGTHVRVETRTSYVALWMPTSKISRDHAGLLDGTLRSST
jgi:hypothetical protein